MILMANDSFQAAVEVLVVAVLIVALIYFVKRI